MEYMNMKTITAETIATAIEVTWSCAQNNSDSRGDCRHWWRVVRAELDGMQNLMIQLGASREDMDGLFVLWAVALERAGSKG